MTNVWHHDPDIDRDVAAIFDPFGNAVHTALSFPVLGEDVLITGAGPIGIMAAAVVRHAGARHVVITDVNPYRLDLARKMGATVALDVQRRLASPTCRNELGMKEGFDVGLEMSGNPAASWSRMAAGYGHAPTVEGVQLFISPYRSRSQRHRPWLPETLLRDLGTHQQRDQ